MNYKEITEITVQSQEELNMIPKDFKGRIYINFSTYWKPTIVQNKYYYPVIARENSSVVAWGKQFR